MGAELYFFRIDRHKLVNTLKEDDAFKNYYLTEYKKDLETSFSFKPDIPDQIINKLEKSILDYDERKEIYYFLWSQIGEENYVNWESFFAEKGVYTILEIENKTPSYAYHKLLVDYSHDKNRWHINKGDLIDFCNWVNYERKLWSFEISYEMKELKENLQTIPEDGLIWCILDN